jgi:Na+-transporting NADH:ubiquinone oxidoreductase subunit NqrF
MDIRVQPLNRVLRVQPGANLLKVLQDAQVPMSCSCMAGRCGTCRCRMLDGQQGYVLACQTHLTEPCAIEIPESDEVVVHPVRIVKVSGPLGSACLRPKHEGPMLCVGGGTGLAPILSILRGAVAQGMRNPMHLYFGVRSPRDVYGMPWLDQLKREHAGLNVHVVVGAGGDPQTQRCGLVTGAIEKDHGDLTGWRAYLCGSPPMLEAATVVARNRGIAAGHIHADAFYTQGDHP